MHEILSMPQSGSFIPFFPRTLGWNPTRFKSYFDSHDFSYCICFFCWAGGFKSLMVFACWMHPLIISKKRGGIILWKPILESKWILSALIGPLHSAKTTTTVMTIPPIILQLYNGLTQIISFWSFQGSHISWNPASYYRPKTSHPAVGWLVKRQFGRQPGGRG